MAKCVGNKKVLLPLNVIQEVKSIFSSTINANLTSTQQRDLTKYVINSIREEAKINGEATTSQIKAKLHTALVSELHSIDEILATYYEIPELQETAAGPFNNLTSNKLLLQNSLDSIDAIIRLTKKQLLEEEGTIIKNIEETLKDDVIAGEEIALENQRERTDFSDNFSLTYDYSKTVSPVLKDFLSFMRSKRFRNDGSIEQLKTFFGTESFIDYPTVYKELHRILSGVTPSYNNMLDQLKEARDKAYNTKNSSLLWVEDVISKLEEQGNDSFITKMFIRDMAKHRINMEFSYSSSFKKDGNTTTSLAIMNNNTSAASKRVEDKWKTIHSSSRIVDTKTGKYNEKEYNYLKALIYKAKKAKRAEKSVAISDLFESFFQVFSMDIPEGFLTTLMDGQADLYLGKHKITKPARLITEIENIVDKLISKDGMEYAEAKVLNTLFIPALAFSVSKFTKGEGSNTFRVGDKLIQTYTANHSFSAKVRDIKSKGIKHLYNTVFLNKSLYGALINNSDTFKNWFNINYVSLNPLVKKNSKSKSTPFTTLSELDREVLHISNAFRSKIGPTAQDFTLHDNSTVRVNVQEGSFITPTMSDKSRAMTMNGYTFRVTKYDENKNLTFTVDSLLLYMKSVVESEIERIELSESEEYISSLDIATYNGGMFYMTPYLNSVLVHQSNFTKAEQGDDDAITLVEAIETGMYHSERYGAAIKNLIYTEVKANLISKAIARKEKWIKLGLVGTKSFGSKKREVFLKNNNVQSSMLYFDTITNSYKYNTGVNTAIEMAMDLTFSEEISNANFFQLIAGDPAQYNPNKIDQLSESVEDAIEFMDKSVQQTNSVITKRLASEIAPGDDGDTSESSHYYQIFLKDEYPISRTIGSLIEILDGKKARVTYEKLRDIYNETEPETVKAYNHFIEQLNAYPYFRVNATDAQEYLTWQSQVEEMYRYAEITKKERELIIKTISSGKNLNKTLLKKVMGPRKPVYSNIENLPIGTSGKLRYDRKTYIKSSTFPLLPQLTAGLELDNLRKSMEKLEHSNTTRKSVRASYKTAVKVGFPTTGISLRDNEGNFKSEFNFMSNSGELVTGVRLLRTDGLRMQQSIPYVDKAKEPTGSQEKKLLFSGTAGMTFTYKKNKIKSEDLRSIYESLYKEFADNNLRELNERLRKDGKLNYKKVSNLLNRELRARNETSIPLLEGLKINPKTGTFNTPLWKSPYRDEYMNLLNSIVTKSTLTTTIPGMSSVLASEEGFMVENSDRIDKAGGIVYTSKYNKETGLLGVRLDKAGNTLPAQILLPFKFRDKEGNLLNAEDFVDKETGLIELKKFPEEISEAFSFRIPTQLQNLTAYVEIVGFLPYSLGDVAVASQDFTVQMGSDFDVDKLYSYIYSLEFNNDTKTFTTIPRMEKEEVVKLAEKIENKIKELNESQVNKITLETKNTVRDAAYEAYKNRDDQTQSKKEIFKEAYSEFREIRKNIAKKYSEAYAETMLNLITEKEQLYDKYKKSIQNELLKVKKTVMLSKQMQQRAVAPLTSGNYELLANTIAEITGKEGEKGSIISYSYNDKKIGDGSEGGTGISIFSSDSILQVSMEGKKLTARELDADSNKYFPYITQFGTEYAISTGNLGLTHSLKKGSKRFVAEFISALQNISVDNANLEAMAKINLNSITAGAYSFLHMLGFEEDITAMFMSQPILQDYVQELKNAKGFHAEYNEDLLLNVQLKLIQKYSKNYSNSMSVLADFKNVDAFLAMKEMLIKGTSYPNFGNTQVAILNKFLSLTEKSTSLQTAKKYLNLDSKGLPRNMYDAYKMKQGIEKLNKSPIEGLSTLLWEENAETGTIKSTLAGIDYTNGLLTYLNLFGKEFLESNPIFTGAIKSIEDTLDRDLNSKEIYEVRNNFTDFMNTNLVSENSTEMRKELFFNTKPGSLYSNINLLLKTTYAKNNRFLNAITTSKERNGMAVINFNKVAGDSFDDEAIYSAFIDALTNNAEFTDSKGTLIVSEIMQQLAFYGVLKGGRASTSFIKFIPNSIINAISGETRNIKPEIFVKQFFRNNVSLLPDRKKDKLYINDKGNIELSEYDISPIALRRENTLYLRESDTSKTYIPTTSYENADVSTYVFPVIEVKEPIMISKDVDNSSDTGIEQEVLPTSALEYPDAITNALSTALANGETFNNISEVYLLLNKDKDKLGDKQKLLMAALEKVAGDTKVVIDDDIEEYEAEYSPAKNTIYLPSKLVLSAKPTRLVKAIMHEHIHALSFNKIKEKSLTGNFSPAMQRVREHIFNMVTDMLSENNGNESIVKVNAYENILAMQYSSASVELLESMANQALHPRQKKVFTEMAIYRKKIIKKLIPDIPFNMTKEGFSNTSNIHELSKILERSAEIVYATTNMYEYTAVTPTSLNAMREEIENHYPSFIENIKSFLRDLLESIGIVNPSVVSALTDLYDIIGIEAENPFTSKHSVRINGQKVHIENNTIVNTLGIPIVKKGSIEHIQAVEHFIASYQGLMLEDVIPVLSLDKINSVILTPNSSLLDKILALTSLYVEHQKHLSIPYLEKQLGISNIVAETTIISEKIETRKNSTIDQIRAKYSKTSATNMNTSPKTEINGENAKDTLKALAKVGKEIQKKCAGASKDIKAKEGLLVESSPIVTRKWTLLEKLDGPAHSAGGIDISIADGKVHFSKDKEPFKAKEGLFIPANNIKFVEIKEEVPIPKRGKTRYIKRKS